jgi:hypothetical protein
MGSWVAFTGRLAFLSFKTSVPRQPFLATQVVHVSTSGATIVTSAWSESVRPSGVRTSTLLVKVPALLPFAVSVRGPYGAVSSHFKSCGSTVHPVVNSQKQQQQRTRHSQQQICCAMQCEELAACVSSRQRLSSNTCVLKQMQCSSRAQETLRSLAYSLCSTCKALVQVSGVL